MVLHLLLYVLLVVDNTATNYRCNLFSNYFTVHNETFMDICGNSTLYSMFSVNSSYIQRDSSYLAKDVNLTDDTLRIQNGFSVLFLPFVAFDSNRWCIIFEGYSTKLLHPDQYNIILGPYGGEGNCQIRYQNGNGICIYSYRTLPEYWECISLPDNIHELHTLIFYYDHSTLHIYQNNKFVKSISKPLNIALIFGRIGAWYHTYYGTIAVKNVIFSLDVSLNEIYPTLTIAPTSVPTIAPTTMPTIEPTIDPTIEPTTIPTTIPIAPTTMPTIAPTSAPTVTTTTLASAANESLNVIYFGVGIGSLLICLLFLIISYYIYHKHTYSHQKHQALYIQNGLVILIGIADYDHETDKSEINGYLHDLPGIDHDIENMVSLFHDELNYDIYPSQHVSDIKNSNSPKTHWTEQELHNFLTQKAQYLEKNIDDKKKYDGLVVVLSCHGIRSNIVTSDHKKFSKLAIHRMFSALHPKSRQIPRLFLFDCCSGNNKRERRASISMDIDNIDDPGKTIGSTDGDLGKQIRSFDIDDAKSWQEGDHNPDFRLALIEAANPGFQSKLRIDTGSYVIHSFYQKMIDIVKGNKKTFIHNVFDEIQDELHKSGKQHPTYIWNDNTRYIRLKRRDN